MSSSLKHLEAIINKGSILSLLIFISFCFLPFDLLIVSKFLEYWIWRSFVHVPLCNVHSGIADLPMLLTCVSEFLLLIPLRSRLSMMVEDESRLSLDATCFIAAFGCGDSGVRNCFPCRWLSEALGSTWWRFGEVLILCQLLLTRIVNKQPPA